MALMPPLKIDASRDANPGAECLDTLVGRA